MARSSGDVTVTLSVLDRLIDLEPSNSAEAHPSRAESLRQLKRGVRRDLEWLLNTRCNVPDPGESMPDVSRSLHIYGLPDFSSYSMSSPDDQSRLLRQILSAIKLFEPRLASVRLTPVGEGTAGVQRVKLRIDAMLLMDPAPEPVSFDTYLELRSGVCRLTGDADAR